MQKSKAIFILALSFLCSLTDLASSEGIRSTVPSVNQLTKFAGYIEASIANGNTSFFNHAFDKDALLDHFIANDTFALTNAYVFGFVEGIKQNFDLGTLLVEEIKEYGSYTFLHAFQRAGTGRLLFRLLSKNGINYHEFEVESDDEELKITDAFMYLSGEKISETMERAYLSFRRLHAMASSDDDNERINTTIQMEKISAYISEGKSKKAYKHWNNLPLEYKSTTLVQIQGLQIAASLDKETFLKEYRIFLKSYPENPGKYLIPLEALVAKEYYTEALACIDSLENSTYSDPMLELLRANIFFELGNFSEAGERLSLLIDRLPDYETAYLSLLGIYMKEKKFSDATVLLEKMSFTFNQIKEDLQPILVQYPEFLDSQEYKKWLEE